VEPKFVRIVVESDSDTEEEEEDEKNVEDIGEVVAEHIVEPISTKPVVLEGFRRIAIEEDDESDVDNENSKDNPPISKEEVNKQVVDVAKELESLKSSGNELMQQKKLSEAKSVYTQCLQLDNKYLPALNNRAQAYLARKVLCFDFFHFFATFLTY